MFCLKCGNQLPDNSQFCQKCGASQTVASVGSGAAAAVAPARVQATPVTEAPKAKSGRTIPIILGAVLLVVVCWAIYSIGVRHSASAPESTQYPAAPQPQPQLHAQSTGNVAFTIAAGGTQMYKLTVPTGAFNVNLKGHFQAAGGSGNDVEVYVMNEDEYVNFQNGHSASPYYNSGKVTQDTLNLNLPSDAGTYYAVFSNKFSILTAKAVQANLSLQYYTR